MIDTALGAINQEYLENYKDRDFYQKAAIIADYMQALGNSNITEDLYFAWGELQNEMWRLVLLAKNNPDIWENPQGSLDLQSIAGFEGYDPDQLLQYGKISNSEEIP